MKAVIKVVAIDDDVSIRELLWRIISTIPDTEVIGFSSFEEARQTICQASPDIIFVDGYIYGEKETGLDFVRFVKGCLPATKIVGMSGRALEEEFLEAGADEFLFKPFKVETVRDIIVAEMIRRLATP